MMHSDSEDLTLLKETPAKLLEKYHDFFVKIVRKYFNPKYNPSIEAVDIVQKEYEALLNGKFKTIQQNFRENSSVKTYLTRIFIYDCFHLNRKGEKRELIELDLRNEFKYKTKPSISDYNLEETFKILDEILNDFQKVKMKLELCFKIVYGIGINENDINMYNINCEVDDKKNLLDKFSNYAGFVTKKDTFEILSLFINKYENKDVTSDALRKWVEYYSKEIRERFNNIYKSDFDDCMLGVLLNVYYQNKKKISA